MNLADLLFGAYRRDVLGLLLMHPGESYHVREIARMTGRPANTLYRELAALAMAGLLLRRAQGNQVHYQANTESLIYEELRGILKKTTGIADVLREALAPLAERVQLAFVYGSIASGKEGARSDVDVMVVGDLKFEDAVRALASAEKILRREINPHVQAPREFRAKLARKEPFLLRVLEGPKILLKGDLNDFAKPRRHRSAKAA
jgi:predicted nucleotidyltransferase